MKQQQYFWKGKAFYVALALIVAGAAGASFLAINSMMSALDTTEPPPSITHSREELLWESNRLPAETKQQEVPIAPKAEKPVVEHPKKKEVVIRQEAAPPAASSEAAPPAVPPIPPVPQTVSPVSGELMQGFSGDELIYHTTMKDWRTHNGADLKASMNHGVHAPVAGTVTAVEQDNPLWGGVLEITAADQTVVRLCGLVNLRAKQGDEVAVGDTVGMIGEIPCEISQESHLHWEVLQNGAYIDPMTWIK